MDHDAIRTNGWRQGKLFSRADTEALADVLGVSIGKDALFVLVSHDCDVVHSQSAEPYVYACVAEPIEAGKSDGNKFHGKNSRFLQIPVQTDEGDAFYEIHAALLLRINREKLQTLTPHGSFQLSAESTETLAHWLANRFERAAFPDAFNERIRSARKAILDKFKKHGEQLTAVFLTVDPDNELTGEDSYRVSLVAVMDSADYADESIRISVSEAIGKVAAFLKGCEGIEVLNHEVLPESQVSLEDQRYLKRWDLDYLSLREGDDPPPR